MMDFVTRPYEIEECDGSISRSGELSHRVDIVCYIQSIVLSVRLWGGGEGIGLGTSEGSGSYFYHWLQFASLRFINLWVFGSGSDDWDVSYITSPLAFHANDQPKCGIYELSFTFTRRIYLIRAGIPGRRRFSIAAANPAK